MKQLLLGAKLSFQAVSGIYLYQDKGRYYCRYTKYQFHTGPEFIGEFTSVRDLETKLKAVR